MAADPTSTNDVLSFGPFRLAVSERLLTRQGVAVELGGRALDILIVLVSASNEVVNKKELLSRVWHGVVVEESNLRFHIKVLRKTLGDGKDGARYITTVPGCGYCFVAPVSRARERESADAIPPNNFLQANLPGRLTRMVGRDGTVRELCSQVLGRRLVSIVGPGGIGKTTVAVAVAHELSEKFPGAVCFVDLGSLSEPALLITTVAVALGCSTTGQDPLVSLATFLEGKRILLVLDGCEHLIAAIAVLAERLYGETSNVHILATTREALRVEGENVHLLLPL